MSFYNTGNPVPSIDPRDLDDNAKHIDELTNSTFPTFVDRLGTTRRTLAGIEADNALLTQPGGSALVGTLVNFLGGMPRTVAAKVQDVLDVRDFGAIGGGSGFPISDWYLVGASNYRGYANLAAVQVDYPFVTSGSNTIDYAGFQAAWNYADATGKSVIECGSSTWVIDKTITGKPVLFDGRGEGRSNIIWDDMAGTDGISFLSATEVGTTGGVINLGHIARGSNGGVGIRCPKNSSQYSTFFTKWRFENIFCRGTTRNLAAYGFCYNECFQTWLNPGDCAGFIANNITIHGTFDISIDPAGQVVGYGINPDANGAILIGRISNIQIFAMHTPIAVGDRVFFSLDNYDLSGYNGVFQVGVLTAFNEPKIGKGNINCQSDGIYFTESSAREINSATIRRHSAGWKGATNNWHAIRIANSTSVKITGCIFQPDESAGAFTGTQYGVKATACGSLILEGNMPGLNLDFVYDLDNCSGFVVNDTMLAGLSGTVVMLRNGSRNGRITQPVIPTSAAVYTMVDDDTTINYATVDYLPRNQVLESTSPFQLLRETDGATDNKTWRTIVNGGVYQLQQLNDAGSAVNWGLITSVAHAITNLEWRGARIFINGSTTETNLLRPVNTNTSSLGDASHLWTTVFATTGTINTSDARYKTPVRPMRIEEISAAKELSRRIGIFKWLESVEAKGQDARQHVGLTVQSVIEVMDSYGLDAMSYGFICYDEWPEQLEEYSVDGELSVPAMPAGNRYGFRMDQLNLFIAAGIEARLSMIEAS